MFDFIEFWQRFWQNFDEDKDTQEVENLIFRSKNGEWKMAIAPPNDNRVIEVKVYFNPWTGEELK